MPTDFVLELRNVSSLTEARFAAGEGFTHIRLSADLAGQGEAIILGIKEFLSGLALGVELDAGEPLPGWADYAVQGKCLRAGHSEKLLAEPDEADGNAICVVEEIKGVAVAALPLVAGLSLPSPAEYKTGFADFEPLQNLLEEIRTHYGLEQ